MGLTLLVLTNTKNSVNIYLSSLKLALLLRQNQLLVFIEQ